MKGQCGMNATCSCYKTLWYSGENYGHRCELYRQPSILWAGVSVGIALFVAFCTVMSRVCYFKHVAAIRSRFAKHRMKTAMNRIAAQNKATRRRRAMDHFKSAKLREGWTDKASAAVSAFKHAAPTAGFRSGFTSAAARSRAAAAAAADAGNLKPAPAADAKAAKTEDYNRGSAGDDGTRARRWSSSSSEDEEMRKAEEALAAEVLRREKEVAARFRERVRAARLKREEGVDEWGSAQKSHLKDWRKSTDSNMIRLQQVIEQASRNLALTTASEAP